MTHKPNQTTSQTLEDIRDALEDNDFLILRGKCASPKMPEHVMEFERIIRRATIGVDEYLEKHEVDESAVLFYIPSRGIHGHTNADFLPYTWDVEWEGINKPGQREWSKIMSCAGDKTGAVTFRVKNWTWATVKGGSVRAKDFPKKSDVIDWNLVTRAMIEYKREK